ncbi:hypothetical protein DM02DRAFT_631304 [Periconia macrospinosa]|uniref:Uncharacterized protein n=1 Tax=Periconia macrospinosa TaxID=97972 RepID=A0A2V1DGR3_9PLEO|nr:hypothetical protein DM02DRAFT_631304 [Periconia macrospinosa]
MATSWNCSTSLELVDRCNALSETSLPVSSIFVVEKDEFLRNPNTKSYLGNASRMIYTFVRDELGVPFHEGLVEHSALKLIGNLRGRPGKTIGSWASIIFTSIVDDRMWEAMADVA